MVFVYNLSIIFYHWINIKNTSSSSFMKKIIFTVASCLCVLAVFAQKELDTVTLFLQIIAHCSFDGQVEKWVFEIMTAPIYPSNESKKSRSYLVLGKKWILINPFLLILSTSYSFDWEQCLSKCLLEQFTNHLLITRKIRGI